MRYELIKSEGGVVLFLVLWVLILLSVIAGQFCYAMRTEANIVRNLKEETQAHYIAETGIYRAVAEVIRNEVDPPDQPGQIDYAEEMETERWRINVDIGPLAFDQGFFTVKIGNESGKININTADRRLLGLMLDGFDLEDGEKDTIVDSILDWRDSDKLHRLNGAEDDYYLSLSDPYPCKDGDFDSLEELMLVKGVTREIYYGGLNDMITIYTGGSSPTSSQPSRRAKASGSGGININAASDHMLRALPLMTDDLVEAVKAYRKEENFESMTDLVSVVGQEAADAMRPYIHFSKVRFYNIRSIGMFKGNTTRKGIEALIQVDIRSEKGFRVIRWIDDVDYQVTIPAS